MMPLGDHDTPEDAGEGWVKVKLAVLRYSTV